MRRLSMLGVYRKMRMLWNAHNPAAGVFSIALMPKITNTLMAPAANRPRAGWLRRAIHSSPQPPKQHQSFAKPFPCGGFAGYLFLSLSQPGNLLCESTVQCVWLFIQNRRTSQVISQIFNFQFCILSFTVHCPLSTVHSVFCLSFSIFNFQFSILPIISALLQIAKWQ